MKKQLWLVLAIALAVSGAGCGKKKDGKGELHGGTMEQAIVNETNLADLVKNHSSSVVTPQPWIGYWFPYTISGVATRAYGDLSPAEKYDIAYVESMKQRGLDVADYEPMAEWERGWHGPGASPKIESWWGHCNGWSSSALMVPEPREPKVINGVTFDVHDLKALLAESWLVFSGDFVGTRVDDKNDTSSAAFWDISPAQFHLILSNVVGRQNRGVVLDRYTGDEIWNQPLVAYYIEPPRPEDYLGAHPQYPLIYRINMRARIWWANDNVGPGETTPQFDMAKMMDEYYDYFFPGRKLYYELWLDAPAEFDAQGNLVKSGNILVTQNGGRYVGGEWKNGMVGMALKESHPDYMWTPYAVQHATYYPEIVLWDKNPRIDDSWVRDHIGAPVR